MAPLCLLDPFGTPNWTPSGTQVSDLANAYLVHLSRILAPSVIKPLSALGLERAEIDAVIIPSRTLQHRRSRREKLTVEESDRVLRVIRVLSLTESVYGSRERALAWLRKPHPRLDERTPLSLLKTDAGSRIVEELLIQIDEGMFV